MAEPRPVAVLLLLQGFALLALGGWWVGLSAAERWRHLTAVWVTEHVATVPPAGLVAQASWLVAHRGSRLQGSAGLVVLAGLIGSAEGWAWRRRDVLGGFRLARWTAGITLCAFLPGSVAAVLVAPCPLDGWWLPWGSAGLVGSVGVLIGAGRPYVP